MSGTLVDENPTDEAPRPEGHVRTKRIVTEVPSAVDRRFNFITMAAGISVLVLLLLVGLFLLIQSSDALGETGRVELRRIRGAQKIFQYAIHASHADLTMTFAGEQHVSRA